MSTLGWDGDDYQARFDRLPASGTDVHGEASFVRVFEPRTVHDAGARRHQGPPQSPDDAGT
jgi:hypothetical protein